jgi:NO-binding membrane sensor protein with MHYT domain
MLLAQLLTAFAFVWIYRKGREGKPCLFQGVRYGLAIAAMTIIPKFLTYYSVQPMPGGMVFKQIIFDTIAVVLAAIVVARLNK